MLSHEEKLKHPGPHLQQASCNIAQRRWSREGRAQGLPVCSRGVRVVLGWW